MVKNKYNVILVGIDTLRADHLGCYGHNRDTSPTIDSIAKEGTLFEQCFSQAPITSPSFMSIMTSLYPSYHGVTDFMGTAGAQGRAYTLGDSIPTLAEMLKENGYRTGAFTDGGQLYSKIGFERGFDYYSMNPDYMNRPNGSIEEDEIFYWLKEYHKENFFLFFHTYAVHSPWRAPKSYWELFENKEEAHFSLRDFLDDSELPNIGQVDVYPYFYRKVNRWIPADVEYVRSLYDGGIRYVDDFIQRLRSLLVDLKIDSNTIIIITADHGEEFLDHGRLMHTQLYDEILHVPLIIVAPGMSKGVRVKQTVRSIDILPTLFDQLGGAIHTPINGVSLTDADKKELSLPALAETEHMGYVFREKEFKYIYPFYRIAQNRFDELYNTVSDPRERNNIALQNLDIVQEMMHRYAKELHNPNFSPPRRGVIYAAKTGNRKRFLNRAPRLRHR